MLHRQCTTAPPVRQPLRGAPWCSGVLRGAPWRDQKQERRVDVPGVGWPRVWRGRYCPRSWRGSYVVTFVSKQACHRMREGEPSAYRKREQNGPCGVVHH